MWWAPVASGAKFNKGEGGFKDAISTYFAMI
jgi:hypothetical protein